MFKVCKETLRLWRIHYRKFLPPQSYFILPHHLFKSLQTPPCKQLYNCIRESPNKPGSYRQIRLCLLNSPCSTYRFWKPANKDMEFLASSFECLGFSLDLAGGFNLCKDSPGILPLGMTEETYPFCSHPASCQETQVMWFYEFMLTLQQPGRRVSLQHHGLKSELYPHKYIIYVWHFQLLSINEVVCRKRPSWWMEYSKTQFLLSYPVPMQCTESIKLQQSALAFDPL